MSNTDTEPKYQVLPEYTDERILAATEGRADAWADAQRRLLTIPAEWRRSVWASTVEAVTTRVLSGTTSVPEWVTAEDISTSLCEIVDRFHDGYRPRRCETQVQP